MKWLLVILFPVIAYSQSDTCFTKQQVLDISFTIDSLTDVSEINQRIIREQGYLIADLKHYAALDSAEISYYKRQVTALNKNIDLYIEREKFIKPKWYDNKTIWFASGIISTVLTARLIVEVVK